MSKVDIFQERAFRLELLKEKCTVALRKEFLKHYSSIPTKLYKQLSFERAALNALKQKRILHNNQYELLYPAARDTDVYCFDITLLVLLLRSICHLHPPLTGWNTNPSQSDNSISANIVRIRLLRNKFSHSNRLTFHEYQQILFMGSTALLGLGCTKKDLSDIETCCLDRKMSKKWKRLTTYVQHNRRNAYNGLSILHFILIILLILLISFFICVWYFYYNYQVFEY